jgi:hypothetical protein
MRLCDALKIMEDEQIAMRRQGWHNGLCYAYIDTSKGFVEPFTVQRRNTVTLAMPYHPQRADWCTDDWYALSLEEREAIDAHAQNIPSKDTNFAIEPNDVSETKKQSKKAVTKKPQLRAKAQKA